MALGDLLSIGFWIYSAGLHVRASFPDMEKRLRGSGSIAKFSNHSWEKRTMRIAVYLKALIDLVVQPTEP